MKMHGLTHQGWVRRNNEDRFIVRTLSDTSAILAVADGMGGQAGGEVAARIVMDTVSQFMADNTGRFDTREKDLLLLCSDGLSGMVRPDAIARLAAEAASVRKKAESLLDAALKAGGFDNITVIVAEI